MSRFYLSEFRYPRRKRWHPWARHNRRGKAVATARALFLETQADRERAQSRAVRIDTDAGSIEICWEAP